MIMVDSQKENGIRREYLDQALSFSDTYHYDIPPEIGGYTYGYRSKMLSISVLLWNGSCEHL